MSSSKKESENDTLVSSGGVIPLEVEDGESNVVELKAHTSFPAENEWYHSSLLLLADIVGSGAYRRTFEHHITLQYNVEHSSITLQ